MNNENSVLDPKVLAKIVKNENENVSGNPVLDWDEETQTWKGVLPDKAKNPTKLGSDPYYTIDSLTMNL